MKPARAIEESLIDRLARPFQIFAAHKLSGAVLLLAATVVAVAWANSPWAGFYHHWLQAELSLSVGPFGLSKSVSHWIADGLMGIFFFVVGLEIKRELLAGELANPRKAALPVIAAVGGMVVPALVYFAFNGNGEFARGWGIPMATDIAFALGILAVFPVPVSLKIFLTALAIVDDIGAIIVVAIFYADAIAAGSLLIGALLLGVSVGTNVIGVRNPIIYFLIGCAIWLAFSKSGVHATLAGVLMAFTIPARSVINARQLHDRTRNLLAQLRNTGLPADRSLLTSRQHHIVLSMEQLTDHAAAPLQQLEHALMPFVTFAILPLFALTNAGVSLDSEALSLLAEPMSLGIILGLVVGKPLGIWLFAWASVKLRVAELPKGINLLHVASVGCLAGVGFTMSLFIATLAFEEVALVDAAKTAVLAGSLLATLIGSVLLLLTARSVQEGA
ncbi:MAG: Na+/H+ antiporter NhaA [Nitrospira sp. SB0672_bin_25]|nr:Na+/H+ antiporter NhaA [Nitrospira sp. SB0666_bin_27]MYF23995.1 Na+/H+ antiporter NhaA [Nitrospira sp. SB0678_bin_10]MYJ53694.1 Na+/H+ antiporter NhaA [Nitrospira sp. SB0672_bin_25]